MAGEEDDETQDETVEDRGARWRVWPEGTLLSDIQKGLPRALPRQHELYWDNLMIMLLMKTSWRTRVRKLGCTSSFNSLCAFVSEIDAICQYSMWNMGVKFCFFVAFIHAAELQNKPEVAQFSAETSGSCVGGWDWRQFQNLIKYPDLPKMNECWLSCRFTWTGETVSRFLWSIVDVANTESRSDQFNAIAKGYKMFISRNGSLWFTPYPQYVCVDFTGFRWFCYPTPPSQNQAAKWSGLDPWQFSTLV